jgi:hypothetical protein
VIRKSIGKSGEWLRNFYTFFLILDFFAMEIGGLCSTIKKPTEEFSKKKRIEIYATSWKSIKA